jgi:hypothetical protein
MLASEDLGQLEIAVMPGRRCGFGSCEQGKLRVQCEDTSDRSYARLFASMFSVKVLECNCST